MKQNFLLFSLLIILLVCVVAAEDCDIIGKVDYATNTYCDLNMTSQTLKLNDTECWNNYECIGGSCAEGVCQGKLDELAESNSLFAEIFAFISGKECNPENTSYHCEGEVAYLCGANWVWEDKGKISGECGYSPSGGSSSNYNILIYSPINITYSTSSVSLKVSGTSSLHYWAYTLNGGTKINFVPNVTITPRQGVNTLVVYSGRSASTSDVSKTVIFNLVSVAPASSYCGNNICDSGESCSSCSGDCGACVVDNCGNDVCDVDESSATCPEDCPAAKPKNGWRIFALVFLIFLILAIIAIVTIIILLRIKKKRAQQANASKNSSQRTNSGNVGVNPQR